MENEAQKLELKLVPICEEHHKYIYEHLNNEELAETYPIELPYTLHNARLYVKCQIDDRNSGEKYSFAIQRKREFVGVCSLYDIHEPKGEAKVYYWIGPIFWNQGIATRALKKLMRYARIELSIEKLKTGVLERNKASRKVLEKNGFYVESVLVNENKYHQKFIGERFLEMRADFCKTDLT